MVPEYGLTVARPILAGFGQETAYIEQLCARIPDALRTLRNSLTIALVRSPQQLPKCVKIRRLYRRPMQLLEALHVTADGLQAGS